MELVKYKNGMKLEGLKDTEKISLRTAAKLTPAFRKTKLTYSGHSHTDTLLKYIKNKELKAKKEYALNQWVWTIRVKDIKEFIKKKSEELNIS